MKVVLDTNVLLSGLMVPESAPGRIVRAWRAGQFEIVLSEPMLEEIGRVLAYPKIKRRIGWGAGAIQNFLSLLRFKAEVVDIAGVEARVPRDHKDAPVLATFIAAEAEWLVTGDQDLLELEGSYPVVPPATFAKRL